ncbi:MAG: hypothetical protein ACRYFK_10820 [Janthinobacterium lividum]
MRLRATSPYFSRFGLRLGLGLAGLLGSAGLVLATTLSLFVASYTGSAVRVEWEVSTETDLTGFSLSRKLAEEADFSDLTTLAPTGQRYYTYADTSLVQGRAGLLPGPVLYRLTLHGPGPNQAYTTAVLGTTGLVARSWGTIKTMFR